MGVAIVGPIAAIIVQVVIGAIVSTAVGAIGSALRGSPNSRQRRISQQRREQSAKRARSARAAEIAGPLSQSADPGGPQIGLFGRRRVGGRVVLSARSGSFDYLVIVIAGAPATVNAIYMNNLLVSRNVNGDVLTSPWSNGTTFSTRIKVYDGTQTAADTTLKAAFPGWTDAMVGTGQTYVMIRINQTGYDAAFSAGTPDFTFDVSGFPVYDPRDENQDVNDAATWTFSENAALIAAGYLVHDLGRALPVTSVDWASVAFAANVCDESVSTLSGTDEPRYSCAAYWLTNERHEDVIARIEDAMSGNVYFLGDTYRVDAGAFDDAGAPVITPNDYVGDGLAWADTPPMDSIANGVRGQFASPTNDFEQRDFPAYQDAAALAEDGGKEHWLTVDFPFVTSPSQAQRLARIEYNKVRRGSPAAVSTRFKFFDVVRGDVIRLEDPLAGIDGTYRVQADSVDGEFAIDFDLTYEDATFYAWDFETDEVALPEKVELGSGSGAVDFNPDDVGALKPPGGIFYGSGAVGAHFANVQLSASPSARATHYDFELRMVSGQTLAFSTSVGVATVTATMATTPNSTNSTISYVRVRARVSSTGETSAWNTLNPVSLTIAQFIAAPQNNPATSTKFVLPTTKAMQVQSQSSGNATLRYFAAGGRTDQILIYRNTTNSAGGTLIATQSNVNGTIAQAQTPGVTRYYFTRAKDTTTGKLGPWSNALIVAF